MAEFAALSARVDASVRRALLELRRAARAETKARMPAGTVSMFGGTTVPTGWLECNGAAVSRTTYADLFAAIGTTHGVGDGSTTFNLPDLRGRFPAGFETSSPWAGTVGASGGSEDAVVVDHYHVHAHTHTIAHTHSMAHTHSVNPPSTALSISNPPAGVNAGSTGDVAKTASGGFPRTGISGTVNIASFTSGGSSAANTGGSSAANSGSASTSNTDSFGVSATRANLPPYEVLKFMIRT